MKDKIKKIIGDFFSKLPLQDIIVMEGLNDLDGNTGAFFEYLIENDYNKKYKIIWLLENLKNKRKIENTLFLNINKKNILYKSKIYRAKYLICDNKFIEKLNKNQKLVYLTHGFPMIKNVKGIINVPKNCNYVCCTSEKFIKLAEEQFSTDKKNIFINGLPRNDKLFKKTNEIKKITNNHKYSKIIMWMPTFRKAKDFERNDTDKELTLGIPFIYNNNEYKKLNEFLKNNNVVLIIKIHPGQDLSVLKINDLSNVKVYTVNRMLDENIDLYKLFFSVDALISDYSSVSFDYMLLNRPIAYNIDDIDSYKLGFAFEDVYEYMPGYKLKDINDLYEFIKDVLNNVDKYEIERNNIKKITNKYDDDNNCKRLVEYLEIDK